MNEFNDQWVVILGGSSGLGLATAQRMAAAGAHICIVHRSRRSQLQELNEALKHMQSQGSEVIAINADATQPQALGPVVKQIKQHSGTGKVRALVHSIAKGNLKPMHSEQEETLQAADFSITLEAMATSLYLWVDAFAKANLFASSARVIAFTSEGSRRPLQNYGAVGAAKAALESIVRSIAMAYAPLGITANCIQAGVTDTPSLRKIPGVQELLKHSEQRNPSGRLTTPQDVAHVVYLLCREEARWINGAIIPVDGGEHLGL
ncbi:enoyl-ACP reductase FabI [Croceiramulus getboli]|nr:SDR family oxidoreductase [Flavobacteriaceae bacterium YJPT1-3]